MFEWSLLEVSVARDRRRVRWFTLLSVVAQTVVIGGSLALPLVFPERLPSGTVAAKRMPVEVAAIKPKPVQPVRLKLAEMTASRVPESVAAASAARGGAISRAAPSSSEIPVLLPFGSGMGHPGLPADLGSLAAGNGAEVRVAPAARKAAGPVRISSGVTSGMLLTPYEPRYPSIALAAKVQGAVVLKARIDRQGRVANIEVQSGPVMLRQAALDAVKGARYRPYLLNGEPTEVETTITVNFRLAGG